MGRRTAFEFQLGGMHDAGDGAKMPADRSRLVVNCAVCAAGVVKRDPITKTDATPNAAGGYQSYVGLRKFRDELIARGGGYNVGTRGKHGGPWSEVSYGGVYDTAVNEETCYALTEGTSASDTAHMISVDTDGNLKTAPLGFDLYAKSIDYAIGRVMLGAPSFKTDNVWQNTAWGFENPTWWAATDVAVSEAPSTPSPPADSWYREGPRLLTISANTGYLERQELCWEPAAAQGGFIRLYMDVQFKPVEAEVDVPLQLQILDSSDNILAKQDVLIARIGSAEIGDGTVRYQVRATVPDNATYKFRIVAGNTTKDAAASQRVRLVAAGLFLGHWFLWDDIPARDGSQTYDPDPGIRESYPERIYMTDPLDDTGMLSTNWVKCDEEPGEVTLVRSAQGRTFGFKEDAIWIFRHTDQADFPLIFVDLIRGYGCRGPEAHTFFEGTQFFIGKTNIYAWTGDGLPQPITDPTIRDVIMAGYADGTTAAIGVNHHDRRLWVSVPAGCFVYDLDQGAWAKVRIRDGHATYAEVQPTSFCDMPDAFYMTVPGHRGGDHGSICRLDDTAVRDQIDDAASSDPINMEYWLHTIDSPNPPAIFSVDALELDHETILAQTNSSLIVSVSRDGGATWEALPERELAAVSADTQPIKVPVQRSGRRILMKIEHQGDGGKDAFNFNGARAFIQMRGRAIQQANAPVKA